jgi:hypothetical protein
MCVGSVVQVRCSLPVLVQVAGVTSSHAPQLWTCSLDEVLFSVLLDVLLDEALLPEEVVTVFLGLRSMLHEANIPPPQSNKAETSVPKKNFFALFIF